MLPFLFLLNGGFYSTTTVYGYMKKNDVPESYKCLLGILNSNLFWWYLTNTGTILANAYFRFKPDYMKPFPIPVNITKDIEQNMVKYVDKIMESKSNNSSQSTSIDEEKINEIVYSLYDLTDEEIKLIKSTTI
ncbi:MAG: hypothetical protein LBG19_00750 [Prevotellaceae bacterium]|nr:hypothetical protein [Prevotellaceae bacterium]